MTNFELIAEAIEMMNAGNNELAIARLKQFTALNTPKVKGGKIKIYDWTDPKSAYAYGCGVYHDANNGVAVATETHVLLISKPDYNEAHAGKIIDKAGDPIKARYPEYNRVIPKSNIEERPVDLSRIADMLSEMIAEKKVNKGIDYLAFNVCDKDHPFYVSPRFCKLLLTLPAGKFYFSEPFRPMLYKSDDGNYTAIIMPVNVNEKCIGMDKVTYEDGYSI